MPHVTVSVLHLRLLHCDTNGRTKSHNQQRMLDGLHSCMHGGACTCKLCRR